MHSGPLAALLLDRRSCGALEGFPLAALKWMPQGLSWDGKVKQQDTSVPLLVNAHTSRTADITCGCSFISSYICRYRGVGSK